MNRIFSSITDPSTLSRGIRTTTRRNQWAMNADHAFSYLCDELKCSDDESEYFGDATHNIYLLYSSQDDVDESRKPLQAHKYISLASPPYLQCPEPSTHPVHLCHHIAWLLIICSILLTLVYSTETFSIHHTIIDHVWEPRMKCDTFWLPNSVIPDANAIQISSLLVRIWAENVYGAVSQQTAQTMGIWQKKGGMTIQWINNKLRQPVW